MRPKGPWHPAYLEHGEGGKKFLKMDSEVSEEYQELFSEAQMDGSGHDWEAILSPALKHRNHEAWAKIEFDSEGDCFVAKSHEDAPLEALGQLIKDLLHSRHALEKAIHDRD